MKSICQRLNLACLYLLAFSLPCAAQPRPAPSGLTSVSTTEFSYVANSPIKAGTANFGDIDTLHHRLRYGINIPSGDRLSWRVGGEWERYSYGVPTAAPIPNTLNSLNLNLGADWRISRRWSMNLDVDPGIYSDFEDIGIEDFNAPATARLIWAQTERLYWALAVVANPKSEFPIVGGIGAIWRPDDHWTVSVVLPRPQISYRVNDTISVFAGGEFKGGGYRVSESFGTRVGRPNLNNQDIFYREARAGAGIKWNVTEKVSARLEAGWVIDRRFTFPDRDFQLNGDGAPYVQIAIRGTY